jgi:PiT family inorganic phosphate transporter
VLGLDGFADASLTTSATVVLALALFAAFAFEFVNGFHDTANAVATVIYTKTLDPRAAVALSGVCNFLGLIVNASLAGVAVAIGITRLLPVELVVSSGTGRGLAMVGALLASAITWNLATWARGLPASSSHTLIGAILGVGLSSSALDGHFGAGVNWSKAGEVLLSLLVSPAFGFLVAAGMLLLLRRLVRDERVFQPANEHAPPRWIRALLILTCGSVSFAHGSNDGQKGVGLVMLIVVGIVPAGFALDLEASPATVARAAAAAVELTRDAAPLASACGPDWPAGDHPPHEAGPACVIMHHARLVARTLEGHATVADVPAAQRWRVREGAIRIERAIAELHVPDAQRASLDAHRRAIAALTDYAPTWVLALTALALGIGTTIGWKRIVVTVGEKIGKTHLTYAQGASAELVAASTIGVASLLGLPVSTTHVLSSGIAGTMVVEGSGLQAATVRNIAIAWLLTLPVSMLLSGIFFALFSLVAG